MLTKKNSTKKIGSYFDSDLSDDEQSMQPKQEQQPQVENENVSSTILDEFLASSIAIDEAKQMTLCVNQQTLQQQQQQLPSPSQELIKQQNNIKLSSSPAKISELTQSNQDLQDDNEMMDLNRKLFPLMSQPRTVEEKKEQNSVSGFSFSSASKSQQQKINSDIPSAKKPKNLEISHFKAPTPIGNSTPTGFGFIKTSLQTDIHSGFQMAGQTNGFQAAAAAALSSSSSKKKQSVVEDLKQLTGFQVTKAAQNNPNFKRFSDLFENMDDEDEEQLDEMNERADEDTLKDPPQFQNPSFTSIQSFQTAGPGKSKVIDELRAFSGFKVSAATQNNKQFSKFCDLFENMDEEEEQVKETNADVPMKGELSEEQEFNEQSVLNFMNPRNTSEPAGETDGFFGFQTANNSKKLAIDPKKLDILYSSFLGEDGAPGAGKKGSNKDNNSEYDENANEEKKNYDGFFSRSSGNNDGFVGFKTARGDSKLQVDPVKLRQLEKMFDNQNEKDVGGGEIEEEESSSSTSVKKNSMSNSLSSFSQKKAQKRGFNQANQEEEGKEVSQFSTGFTNGFASKKLKLQKNNQESDSTVTPIKRTAQQSNENEEDPNEDPFMRVINFVSKKPAAVQEKRDHPRPFKPVKVTDDSKHSTPSASLKATPIMKSVLTTPSNSGMKSTKVNVQSFSNKAKLSLSEDASSIYLFAKDSAEKQPMLFQSAAKSANKGSIKKPFTRPAMNSQLFDNNSNTLNDDSRLELVSSYKKRRNTGGSTVKKNLFESVSGDLHNIDSSKPIPVQKIPIPPEYSNNPLIQMKYGYDPSILSFQVVKYQELSRCGQTTTNSSSQLTQQNLSQADDITAGIETEEMQLKQDSKVSLQNPPVLTRQYIQQLSKDINACLGLTLRCPCTEMDQPLVLSENMFTKRMDCFCNLSTEKKAETKKAVVNVHDFFLKIQSKHRQITEQWVRTQFRQIVWKLACYESNIRDVPVNKRLTASNIYNELELRLFSEVYACRRSILKQIAEQDAVKSLTMVLIVANIVYNEQHRQFTIELTDGWYSIFIVVFDYKFGNNNGDDYYGQSKTLLLDLISKRKLCAGKKVYVTSIAAPPIHNLEKFIVPNQNLMYQKVQEVHYNSIISAPASAKLGVASNAMQKYFPRSLRSLRPFGGSEIPTIDIFVAKKYPLCYESGLVKKSLCNARSAEDGGMDAGKTIGFTIVAVDALSYYDQSFRHEQQPWVEVNIHTVSNDLYESIKEGTRLRLYNVLITMKNQPKSKFDFRMQRQIKNVLVIDTGKKTKVEEMQSFVKCRDEQMKMRAFGADIVESYKLLLEDVQESVKSLGYDKEILEEQLQGSRVEVDVIMYIVRVENGTYFGINSNYSAICVTPTKEVIGPPSAGVGGDRYGRNSEGDSYDAEPMSKEDQALYERLQKNRDANNSNSHGAGGLAYGGAHAMLEESYQYPSSSFSKAPSQDEGKIGVFLNAQVDKIKQTQLSTTFVDMFLFNYTLNTHKKVISAESNPALQLLPYSYQYRNKIAELAECVRLNSDKFAQVSTYLRNC